MADTSTPTRPVAPRLGEHAIVIGASIAGLLSARVLSDSYDRVTVIDRDALPQTLGENRRAVPQGLHAHGLQPGGQEALEQLFEGFRAETIAAGAPPLVVGEQMRFVVSGHHLRQVRTGSDYAVASRPLVEGLVRRRVRAIANVTIRDRCGADGLIDAGGRVAGVRARDCAPGSPQVELRADLVVAASGRGGKVPAWLDAMGYERPVEERIGVDVLYASRHLRLRPGALGTDKAVLDSPRPDRPRGMVIVAEEGDRWNLSLQGYGPDHRPPTDDAAFNAFAATVAEPHVLEAIEQAEPVSAISTHAFPASLRRRYERLRRFPDGLLVIGDALCSFNPSYGQGMTVAALEATALQRVLRDGDRRLAKRFFKAAGVHVDHAWKLAAGSDLEMPMVAERAALPDRLVGRYMRRVLAVAEHDAVVARTFFEVMGMLAPPTRVLSPAIARRVLRRGAARAALAAAQPAASLAPAEASASA